MMNLFAWLRSKFQPKNSGKPLLRRMMGMLAATREQEVSCDDVYLLLDQFAEAILRNESLSDLLVSIEQHLQVCPDCREEYEALLAVMKSA